MSKNIVIAEGGVGTNFTAKKLKTNLQGGGNCTWIPEDEAADYCTFKELKVTANGTYKASDKNCDGFDKVKVEISADVVPQKTITANGEYDAYEEAGKAGYAHVTVNVPGGGSDIINDKIPLIPILSASDPNLTANNILYVENMFDWHYENTNCARLDETTGINEFFITYEFPQPTIINHIYMDYDAIYIAGVASYDYTIQVIGIDQNNNSQVLYSSSQPARFDTQQQKGLNVVDLDVSAYTCKKIQIKITAEKTYGRNVFIFYFQAYYAGNMPALEAYNALNNLTYAMATLKGHEPEGHTSNDIVLALFQI